MTDQRFKNDTNTSIDDTSRYIDAQPNPVIIKAIGVGGGGGNAVDHMYSQGIPNVSFANINTDKQDLLNTKVPTKIVIGDGYGAGNDPEVARKAAEESADRISELFNDDTKMVFITAGMGGGTGTGAAPVVARIAKERGLLTIGIVTIPFLFEGKRKILKALDAATEMGKYVDALMVINNERLTEIYGDYSFLNAFAKADDTLTVAARSISELITTQGMMNLDFKDVNTTLRDGGAAIISTGYGEGENRVTKAIEDALQSPLLKNRNIFGSKKLLFNIYFSPEAETEFKMDETNELTNFINNIDQNVDVIWGVGIDNSLGNAVKITLLASGFDDSIADEALPGDDKPRVVSFGKKQIEAAQKPITDKDDLRRIEQEYGSDKVNNMEGIRQRYIILTPNQFDDDEIIEILETTPTYNRDKKIVDSTRSGTPLNRHVDTTTSGQNQINFLS
ncbi:MAG: cell division protein FtsZ [Muribaculaceae bacterium]|nr:cell division protein FtsZ [Muribaculaceae bacterium]